MKKRIIKGVVLFVIFILSVIGFSAYMNQGDTDMTADMNGATLPTIAFEYAGEEVNATVGHKTEMNITSIRDNVIPYVGAVSGKVYAYDAVIVDAAYDIYTLDGAELLAGDKLQVNEGKFQISVSGLPEECKEALLKITLKLEEEIPVYYYTRIANDAGFYAEENWGYIKELHNATISKTETEALKRGLESNAEGDNTTLQHVTIHSDMRHVLWGDLIPEVISEIDFEIKEVNTAYTAMQLSYRVACAGDNNEEEIYNVKEFFKVCYKNGRFYLLAYDRTATETFNVSNVVLSGKGIILGMVREDVPYMLNSDGSIVAFVLERELWSYNKAEDEFSMVFRFASFANNDPRNYYDQHDVRILSMEENGNMTFSVYGYMNRGEHEGESGLAIYYFNMRTNSIEEKAFIRRADSYLVINEELNKLAYYNAEQDILYILVEDDLYKINLTENTTEILVENLQKEQYVTSEEGHMIACQAAGATNQVSVWNFATDKQSQIHISEVEEVIPLGFVGEDFVYGLFNSENIGIDASGASVKAMHRLEIRNPQNRVVKSYEIPDVYILETQVKENMITLVRGMKDEKAYETISDDYITNNEEVGGLISLKSYWTDLKETQYRLLFEAGIDKTSARMLEPKFTLYETLLTFESTSADEEAYYYVYGYGEQKGRFTNAAEAIDHAERINGVVISPGQRYVWEDGNRVAWYRNFNIGRFVAEDKETSLEACVRKVLEYEGVTGVNVTSEMKDSSPEAVLSKHLSGEGIRFRGSSCKDMFYLIDKGTLAIGMTSSKDAILLIGYDALNVTYIDVASGSIRTATIEKVDEMTSGSGNTYIGYVK